MSQNAFSRQKHMFLKTKKADPKHCENWQRESGSEFHKTSQSERGEWQKQLRDLLLKVCYKPPLAPVPFRAFLGLMVIRCNKVCSEDSCNTVSSDDKNGALLQFITATNCSKLQHTATHYNTLQHSLFR